MQVGLPLCLTPDYIHLLSLLTRLEGMTNLFHNFFSPLSRLSEIVLTGFISNVLNRLRYDTKSVFFFIIFFFYRIVFNKLTKKWKHHETLCTADCDFLYQSYLLIVGFVYETTKVLRRTLNNFHIRHRQMNSPRLYSWELLLPKYLVGHKISVQ